MNKGRKLYWLTFALALALAAAYWAHRDLWGRYHAYQRSEESVRAAQQEADTLSKAIDGSRQQVEGLGKDPVEKEAALRRIKNLVRPGETVYRIEKTPPAGGPAAPSKP